MTDQFYFWKTILGNCCYGKLFPPFHPQLENYVFSFFIFLEFRKIIIRFVTKLRICIFSYLWQRIVLPKRVDTLVLNNILQYFVLETFSVSRVILLKSWIWIIPPCRLTDDMAVDFTKKISVSLLVWSVIRKSRVEALIKLRKFMNIC